MKTITRTIIIVAITLFAGSAIYLLSVKIAPKTNRDVPSTISVSILPVKYLVDRITGGDYMVNVILPPGSSPETYEPTPRQLKQLESSPLLFVTGLIDFENSIAAKTAFSGTTSVKLYEGISLIGEDSHSCMEHGHSHSHSHGIDPHIWTSTSCLKIMARNIFENIPESYKKENYQDNLRTLLKDIDKVDERIRNMFKTSGTNSFLIYHPALSYYARDYGLDQIQLEQEGKEPSADKLIGTLTKARELKLDKVLYQKEFSLKVVETAAKDIGAVPVEIDPLAEDILSNLLTITEIIVN